MPVYFTIQPGGAYVATWSYTGPRGVRLVYPNYRQEPAGQRLDFWHYDPSDAGWQIYGRGTVTPNGRQVVPDPGVAIYEFTGAMIGSGGNPPPLWPPPGNNAADGEPVDLSTGLFVMSKTDLFLPDTLPLALTRTYRQSDNFSRVFGIGATHTYEMFLWSTNLWNEADLILPGGGRIHYVCIVTPSCGSGNDIIMEHTATPTAFYKSKLSFNGFDWELKLKDGTVYVFGDLAGLQSIRDRYGNTINFTWSARNPWGSGIGNLLRVSSPNGRWIDFTYDASNRVSQAKDTLGRVVMYAYDTEGRLSTVTDPNGGVTTYTYYTSTDRMHTIKDPRNIVFLTNDYFANGRVMKQTQVDGSTFQFTYTEDAAGKVIQTNVTDPRGFVRVVTFNSAGYSLTDRFASGQPEQQTITYERQAPGNLILSLTDQLNRKTRFGYDALGNLTSLTRLDGTPSALTTGFSYEPVFSQLTGVTDPLSHSIALDYDARGDLTSVTDALQNQITFESNLAGQIVAMTDPLLNRTEFTYESGDLVEIKDPLNRITKRFVDSAGRLAALKDPTGRTVRYEYGPLNQLTRMTDPQAGVTSFGYDGNGNLLSVTDARGKITQYTYDSMDRLKTRKDPLLKVETYDYDLAGNVTKVTDRRGKVTTLQYDPLNRLKFAGFGTVVQGQNTSYESTITFGYDAGNRLRTVADSLAGTITLTPDDLDRLLSEGTSQGTVTYTYDNADRMRTLTVAGQPTVTYDYDDADRLKQATQGASVVTLDYDAASRRKTVTLPNGVSMAYGYDAASQLKDITYKLGATVLGDLLYDYDDAGLRSKVSGSFARTGLPAAVSSTTYNDANQLKVWAGASLNYDFNGNLTSEGGKTYTWNARNQLASISGAQTASFQYDGFGRRISKTVAGVTTGFLYDGANIVQELSGSTPAANLVVGLGMDEVFTRTDSGGSRAFLTDALGSTLSLSDSAGAIQTSYTYEPFGKTSASGPASTNSFQFTGRENDAAGLYYYRARYYDAARSRFISEDPIGFGGGSANLYGYAHNSPTHFVDPLGLKDNASPWQVGREWLTGTEPRSHHFTDGDPFAEQLRRHKHIQQLINDVCSGKRPPSGPANYGLDGLQGIPKYIGDYSTLATGGLTGNLAVTYLGSYEVTYSVRPGGVLHIGVFNESTIASATHWPVFGYTDWWKNMIGDPLNDRFSSGPMSKTTQTFDLHENLAGRDCGCQ